MSDDTTTPAEESAPTMTFQEWKERFEKCYQMNGRPIPEETPDWQNAFDAGITPYDHFFVN